MSAGPDLFILRERKPCDMTEYSSDVGFSPAVKGIQTKKGSRRAYERMESNGGWKTVVTPELSSFIARLDMFYLGTSSATGQPYIQYRGGPPGFLKVIDAKTLGFADFSGNQQYISWGNLSENPQAFLFLMDYSQSRRIKLWGQARVVENDPQLLTSLGDPAYEAKSERAILFQIEAWDINCPQHIHRRFPQREVAPVIEALQTEIANLKAELDSLKREHGALDPSGNDSSEPDHPSEHRL